MKNIIYCFPKNQAVMQHTQQNYTHVRDCFCQIKSQLIKMKLLMFRVKY